MGKLIGKSDDSATAHKAKKAFIVGSYDVVCVGRPAQDTILSGKIFTPVCRHGECFENIPLGSKLNVQDLNVNYGGNALNAAVTFARQDLDVALVSQLGLDSSSQNIAKILEEEGISHELTIKDKNIKIPQSTIIVAPSGERAILAYPGSIVRHQELLSCLDGVDARWIYISSTGSLELLRGVINYAQLNQIKVAFNPGGVELFSTDELKLILPQVDTLIMNKQEASNLFGDLSPQLLCRAAAEYVQTAIITDGPNGAYAYDRTQDYFQPISKDVTVVDRTGAGDAFSSGVVASLAWGSSLEDALLFGSQNSTSVVQQFGAHPGILYRNKTNNH